MKLTAQKIYTALTTDVTLAAYVKEFTMGACDASKLMFPFVNLGEIDEIIDPQTIGNRGSDEYTFEVRIEFGTRELTPDLAYFGDAATGVKGILDVSDDLRSLCRDNLFDGAFYRPAIITRTRIVRFTVGGDWIQLGEMAFMGRRKVRRTRP